MKSATSLTDPRYVKALGHPLRVRLMALLENRTASPRALADLLGVKLGVVAYHVRTLERLGMVELVKETRVRGAVEHHYRLKARPWVTDVAWAEATPIAKQAAVGASLQMIHEYASASAAAGGFDHADAHLTRSSMRLDRKGWEQLAHACQRLLADADRIGHEAAARLKQNPHDEQARDAALAIMMFEAVEAGAQLDAQAPKARRRRPARARTPSPAVA